MAKRRGSIPILLSVVLVSAGLISVSAAVTLQGYAVHAAANEKWRDTAEQAARSGLDFALGWGESTIDSATQLPKDWDMDNDGDVVDPVAGFIKARFGGAGTVRAKASEVTGPGEILGKKVGEFVLSRTGAYVITFKVRLQQYRVTEDLPRQYRIGVIGRVRRVGTGEPAVDTNEQAGIVAERMIVATIGKEPFAKYAVVNDIDLIGNWTPGEVVDGPVHINRGYVDDTDAERKANRAAATATFQAWRSLFTVNTAPAGPFPQPTGAQPFPIFKDLVTLTAINDGNGANSFSDDDFTTYTTVIGLNGDRQPFLPIVEATAQKIFLAPANQGQAAFKGKAGPVLVPTPLELPRTIRTRLTSSLGVPPGKQIQDYPWFKRLEDGVYVFTKRTWDSTSGLDSTWGTRVPAAFQYGSNTDDHAAGGIYIRGNVEILRMTTKGKYSYYMFQLGYGGFDPRIKDEKDVKPEYGYGLDKDTEKAIDNAKKIPVVGAIVEAIVDGFMPFLSDENLDYRGPGMHPGSKHRCYLVRVNRDTREMAIRAFGQGSLDELYEGNVPNGKPDSAAGLDAYIDTPQTKKKKGKKGKGGGAATPTTLDPADFAVTADEDVVAKLKAVPTDHSDFPFNGVIFVDLSLHDPARSHADPEARLAGKTPLTGNIFALGDPGPVGGNPLSKRKFGDYNEELVATNKGTDPATNTKASRLTILAAGNLFIQNHLYLEALRKMGREKNPTQEDFRLSHSRDSLGLVADKQIVIGTNAPSVADPAKPGVIVHAAIAALGDTAFDYAQNKVPDSAKTQDAYTRRGSFAVEGVMQIWSDPEDYQVISWHSAWPTENKPFDDPYNSGDNNEWTTSHGEPYKDSPFGRTWEFAKIYDDIPSFKLVWPFRKGLKFTPPFSGDKYPTNPLTTLYPQLDEPHNNPNQDTNGRGQILTFGSQTIKKRGIVGASDGRGYKKDYRYDRRLQSIAPPLYPTSANLVTRVQSPMAPDGIPYEGVSAGANTDLAFMGVDSPY
jgi:hypothetical protein